MKVIDLLNKISSGEERPKKIIIRGCEYECWSEHSIESYYRTETGCYWFDNQDVRLFDEVEIVEDEFIDIKELEFDTDFGGDFLINDEGNKCKISSHDKTIINRLNKVIKNQKKIIERLENDR